MKLLLKSIFFGFFLTAFFVSCDNNEVIPEKETQQTNGSLSGTGSFQFNEFALIQNNPLTVYYHIPENSTSSSDILIVFHGAARDAKENRDALIANANEKGILLIVPEFSQASFPGGDAYNLGNIFEDGDNPSSSTLNPEEQWTFSIVEPLFDHFKMLSGNNSATYNVFGFSAGAQVAHRFAFFKPAARFNLLVAASSGWYTMPDKTIDFPYGIKKSPIENTNLASLFAKNIFIVIGEADNNPNEGGLRRNSIVDLQGTNRYARAQYFFNQSNAIATGNNQSFNWQYKSLPNVGHNVVLTANYAFDSIFN